MKIYKIQMSIPTEEIINRVSRIDKSLDVWFVGDNFSPGQFYVPRFCWDIFKKEFPELSILEEREPVAIFWQYGNQLQSSISRIIEEISANVFAVHASVAVSLGHNCERELFQKGWDISNQSPPGFYVSISGKDYIFAALDKDPDEIRTVIDIWEYDRSLMAFLKDNDIPIDDEASAEDRS